MPFIGNQPAESYSAFQKQDFSTSATTSYTLDHPVANQNEIALFINFVRQEPTTAYTASGTSLTLTSATSSSDDMYCVYLGKAVQTVNPPSGSVGISQLSATGTKDATTFLRGDNTFAVAGGTNTPMFYGELASNQTLTRATLTKITGMTQNEIDSDTAFDGTTFTVPSGQAGKYFLDFTVYGNFNAVGLDGELIRVLIYKNGSSVKFNSLYDQATDTRELGITVNAILDLSVGDTIEMYGYLRDSDSGNAIAQATYTSILGYKLVE